MQDISQDISMVSPSKEVQHKLQMVRSILKQRKLSAIRLRGSDWFSWATAGGSNVVLSTSETGIAEVFITESNAWVLTNAIEAVRLRDEEIPIDYQIWERPWANENLLDEFIKDHASIDRIASDRAEGTEGNLPKELLAAKRRLMPEEKVRYRKLALEASQAMTETLVHARPNWTEFDLASVGAQNLWKRGIHPALVLAGGDERLFKYRHPVSTFAPLARRALLVFCARKYGLYANLSRFVYFTTPTHQEQEVKAILAKIESAAFSCSQPGIGLNQVYSRLVEAYSQQGFPDEIRRHHQGGLTGYLAREIIATPDIRDLIQEGNGVAWNPSLPGAKIEDTVIVSRNESQENELEFLTEDPAWPSFEWDQRKRPDFLVRP